MIKKITIILCLGMIMLFVNACFRCPQPKSDKFTWGSGNITVKQAVFSGDTLVNYQSLTTDTILQNEYAVQIRIETLLAKAEMHIPSINLMSKAYANKCVEAFFTAEDSIIEINITTLHDFDAQHIANADITSYFKYLASQYTAGAQEIIKYDVSYGYNNFNQSIGFESPNGVGTIFYLDTYPTSNRVMQFAVNLKTTTGKVYTLQTEEIFYKN